MLRCGSTYRIIYTNADGYSSEREITVINKWSKYGCDYVRAYCSKRGEDRTFRLDRMEPASEQNAAAHPYPLYQPSAEPAAAEAVTAAPAPAPAQTVEYKRPAAAHPVLVTLSLLFIIFALWVGFADSAGGSNYRRRETASAASAETVKPPPRKTAEWESAVRLRQERYRITTGFCSTELLELYCCADTNYDNILSWQEIDGFQRRINRLFSYIHNDTALTPVEFLAQGGGDCEDWSIFTCGMLRFWDYTAYVGIVDGGDGDGLHAIALFYKKTPPANRSYRYYKLDSAYSFQQMILPAGCYLPIDYNHAGSFSNASRPDSPLRDVYVPEEIYGRYM